MNERIFSDLSEMLGNSGNHENIENIISNFTSNFEKNNDNMNNNTSNNSNNFDFSNIDIDTVMKIKKVMSALNTKKDDPRSNLLMSLKPYLKPSRRDKMDEYIKFINISSAIDVFNNMGGDGR